MGKKPLAGLIGACTLGMLLTGCNCCSRQSNDHSFMKGAADKGMGFTKRNSSSSSNDKLLNNSSPLVGGGLPNYPAGTSAPSTAGQNLDPASTASNGWGGSNPSMSTGSSSFSSSTNTTPLMGGGGSPSLGNSPSMRGSNSPLSSGSGSGTPISFDSTPRMGGSESLTSPKSASLMSDGGLGSSASSSPIRQVSASMDSTPKVTTADVHSFDDKVQSPTMSRDRQLILPPPPQTMSHAAMSPSDSSSASNSSYNTFGTPSPTPPTPPPPPAPSAPSSSMDQSLSAPPSMSGPAGSSSSPSFGAGTSAKSGPLPPGLDYMNKAN